MLAPKFQSIFGTGDRLLRMRFFYLYLLQLGQKVKNTVYCFGIVCTAKISVNFFMNDIFNF